MNKTTNNETRATKAIRMINKGATWDKVSETLKLSISYVQSIVKAHYKSQKAYNNLLAKARVNKKANAEVEKLIEKPVSGKEPEQKAKEVIVIETGYLMDMGIATLASENLDIYIPYFCIKELEKLSNMFAAAEEALNMYHGSRTITPINLRGSEELFVEPTQLVRDRSKGVVAVCCELWIMGYNVRLLTNSREIEELANLQEIDISTVRVKKS